MINGGRHGAPLPVPPHKTVTQYDVDWLPHVYVVAPGVGHHGGWWMPVAAMVRRCHGLARFSSEKKHTSQERTIIDDGPICCAQSFI